jgi:hypothetical protein
MKKFIPVLSIFVFFVLVHLASAQGFVPLAPIQGLTDSNTVKDASDLAVFFNNLYKFLIGIAAALAVIEIIWGGLEISTKDSVSKQSDGKARIQQAIFGLVLVLSPVLVFSIINPSILNLSLNLPKIDAAPSSASSGDGTLVKPTGEGGLTAETGNIYSCKPAGASGILRDCTEAQRNCESSGVTGDSVTSQVVCITNTNLIDTRQTPNADPATTCPTTETKAIQCLRITLPGQ